AGGPKADEIYRVIPDFGGFLVKANSEGQPGPQDYHRTHADGANLLADAVAPRGGGRDVARVRLLERGAERPRHAGERRVRAAGRRVPGQRADPSEKRPARFPAARAVSSAVRCHAAHAADDGSAN